MSTSAAQVERAGDDELLEGEIKRLIVDALRLSDVVAEDIGTDAPLFDDGLGLDSLDALQLVSALSEVYGVNAGPGDEDTRRQLSSVRSIAALVRASREGRGGS